MAGLLGFVAGFLAYFFVRYGVFGFYTVEQNERAVITTWGKAERIAGRTTLEDPVSQTLDADERDRYCWPQIKVKPPGGPYWKLPWQSVVKIPISVNTVNIAYDPENSRVNHGGTLLEAVTKDQLNTGMTGQLRFLVNERNLYAYAFGVKNPIAHVMGYFISVLRERIANFDVPHPPKEAPALPGVPPPPPVDGEIDHTPPTADEALHELQAKAAGVEGISINDLRKNLRDLNQIIERECASSAARYGITLDAALITGIDPPGDVESALAAINTAYNQVSSEVSLAQASADQKIVQSKRAVEIETLKAESEVEPLNWLAQQLEDLKRNGGSGAVEAYVRNVKLGLYANAKRVIIEQQK
ncbi:band 7 protein [Verrucomicrobia bacterium LW23]|nr:band 7 protein [Verrucomicrobia bacterium LW23]